MSPIVWLMVVLISAAAALGASLLKSSLASGVGAFLVLAILGGVFCYVFGPRPRRFRPEAPHDERRP